MFRKRTEVRDHLFARKNSNSVWVRKFAFDTRSCDMILIRVNINVARVERTKYSPQGDF